MRLGKRGNRGEAQRLGPRLDWMRFIVTAPVSHRARLG